MESVKVSNKHLFNAECLKAEVTLTAGVGLQLAYSSLPAFRMLARKTLRFFQT